MTTGFIGFTGSISFCFSFCSGFFGAGSSPDRSLGFILRVLYHPACLSSNHNFSKYISAGIGLIIVVVFQRASGSLIGAHVGFSSVFPIRSMYSGNTA